MARQPAGRRGSRTVGAVVDAHSGTKAGHQEEAPRSEQSYPNSTSFDTSLVGRYLVEAHLLCELAAVADAAVLEQLRQERDEDHLAESEGEL